MIIEYLGFAFGIVCLLILLWALLQIGLMEKPDYEDDDKRADRIIEASRPTPLSDAEYMNREYAQRPHVRAISEPKGAGDRWTRVL
jgi:hypothetical protein